MDNRAALGRGLLRNAILIHEERHPAADRLTATAWIARVAEQVGFAAVRVDERERESLIEDPVILAAFAAAGAEAIRGAARFHPEADRCTLQWAIDDALDHVESATDQHRELGRATSDLAVVLGLAAGAAIALDTERRGESVDPDRTPAISHLPPDAMFTSLLGVAEVSAELIESLLPEDE
jgi:hypothetical protein